MLSLLPLQSIPRPSSALVSSDSVHLHGRLLQVRQWYNTIVTQAIHSPNHTFLCFRLALSQFPIPTFQTLQLLAPLPLFPLPLTPALACSPHSHCLSLSTLSARSLKHILTAPIASAQLSPVPFDLFYQFHQLDSRCAPIPSFRSSLRPRLPMLSPLLLSRAIL